MKKILLSLLFFTSGLICKAQTIIDIEGNEYHTITIGTQTWFAENLRTTRFNDSTSIPLVIMDTSWTTAMQNASPAYCSYNGTSNADSIKLFGFLYNWFVVNTNKLCPTGWHVPTDSEWTTLTTFLGESEAGGKLKEVGTTHWKSPNEGADNSSGFTALPSGNRQINGTFYNIGTAAIWWCSSENNLNEAWSQGIYYNTTNVNRQNFPKGDGLSIRCILGNSANNISIIDSDELLIYPNPTRDEIFIKNENNYNVLITIFDLQGKIILSQTTKSNSIDLSNLQNGVYFLKIISSGNVLTNKIVKE